MSDQKHEHEYDGIKELDNQLPRWWLATFYLTIVFSVFYYAYYELGTGPSLDEELAADLRAIEMRKSSAPQPVFPDETRLAQTLKESAYVTNGAKAYGMRCASCHGDKAQGLIGPNLTDNHWLNGDGTAKSLAKLIAEGVPAKGMPPWGPMLSEQELYELTAYVQSLRGSNPPGAKAPQGNLIEVSAQQ